MQIKLNCPIQIEPDDMLGKPVIKGTTVLGKVTGAKLLDEGGMEITCELNNAGINFKEYNEYSIGVN